MLHDDRPYHGGGMGPPIPGRIAWRDQVLWCEHHPHIDLDLMSHCFTAMDRAFLEHWHEAERRRQQQEQWRSRHRR